nr:meprin A subunit beta-like [Nothobranchius furzeri]
MRNYVLLMLSWAAGSAVCSNPVEMKIIDLKEGNCFVNNDAFYDNVEKPQNTQRLAYTAQNVRWTSPIPYVFGDGLDLNAKGVILKAFDSFRVKSCIDFVPELSEEYYISVQNLNGCFSDIGKEKANGQALSIGDGCGQQYLVEHEFLHALGFFHEQCRYDRDEYITIVYANILKGHSGNFKNISRAVSSTFGTPYDYWSVLHYGKDAYSNGNGPTILTKDPKFQNVIGQTLGMSPLNALELNRFYNCNSTAAFQMYCGFINGSMCQMRQCSRSGNGWEMISQVQGGPSSDHTSLLSKNTNQDQETGYFMHASTSSGQKGDSKRLETQRMDLKRECNVQCLQFYYYSSGNESDSLNIWVREFQDAWDSTGAIRLMKQITGSRTSYWKLQHVSLNASKNFQVVFEVQKGPGSSEGGFSIDDVNLSEIECPHLSLQIDEFENIFSSDSKENIYSPRHYTEKGYAYRLAVGFNQTSVMLYVQLLSGAYDSTLEWPVLQNQVTFQMLDQSPNIQMQMSKKRSFMTDQSGTSWTNPGETGSLIMTPTEGEVHAGPLTGLNNFMSLEEMQFRDFLKGGSAVFTLSFQDLTSLVNGSTLPCPEIRTVETSHPPTPLDKSPCLSRVSSFSPGLVASPVLTFLLVLKHLEF